jgi:vanillate O-demethylase monooxygenase subunit
MPYLMNCWYVAAWASEVNTGELFPRTLLDQKVVIYRDNEGVAHALLDRCPHRFVPLSSGSLCDGGRSIQCNYHGLQFDQSGQCVHNPHGDGKIPAAARVKTFPLVEKHNCLWIWMGDQDKADPALITDFSCMDREHFYVGEGYLYAKANYVLESDNILDLSHIEFLHPGTLGSDAVKDSVTEVKQDGDTVWSMRQTNNEILPDFLYQAWGIEHGKRVDRWIDVRWDAPANMLLVSGATPTGQPRENGIETLIPHIFTPETAHSTHYWFGMSFPKAIGPHAQQLADEQVANLSVPFETEDLPMLEAQQDNMGDSDFWENKPVLLIGDAGAIRARRTLDKLIKAENAAT